MKPPVGKTLIEVRENGASTGSIMMTPQHGSQYMNTTPTVTYKGRRYDVDDDNDNQVYYIELGKPIPTKAERDAWWDKEEQKRAARRKEDARPKAMEVARDILSVLQVNDDVFAPAIAEIILTRYVR